MLFRSKRDSWGRLRKKLVRLKHIVIINFCNLSQMPVSKNIRNSVYKIQFKLGPSCTKQRENPNYKIPVYLYKQTFQQMPVSKSIRNIVYKIQHKLRSRQQAMGKILTIKFQCIYTSKQLHWNKTRNLDIEQTLMLNLESQDECRCQQLVQYASTRNCMTIRRYRI